MKTTVLRGIFIAAAVCLAAAHADHMSPWTLPGEGGWANMPNDIHNMRFETLQDGDNDRFIEFVRKGAGAESTNRYLDEDAAAVVEEPASGHRVLQLAARLFPAQDFLGGGQARYTLLDDETLVSRVLKVNVRLRLLTREGLPANETLGLTADNAAGATVRAYFQDWGEDAISTYAVCTLTFVPSDEEIDYARYTLSVREGQDGVIYEDSGGCVSADLMGEPDPLNEPLVPDIQADQIVDIGVTVGETDEPSVLRGVF